MNVYDSVNTESEKDKEREECESKKENRIEV